MGVSVQMRRTTRASVSCTTPTRLTISTVTPKKSITRRRPASEMKKSSLSKAKYSSEDDFQPTKSKCKSNSKKAPISKIAPKNWSSSSSSDSDSELPVSRKASTESTTKSKPGQKTR